MTLVSVSPVDLVGSDENNKYRTNKRKIHGLILLQDYIMFYTLPLHKSLSSNLLKMTFIDPKIGTIR